MTFFPIFEHLTIEGFALYPGQPENPGLEHSFQPGLTLVLGANGLGKSTLVALLHRMCTGTYDMPKLRSGGEFGGRSIGSRRLTRTERRTFANRVSDDAKHATASLSFHLGDLRITTKRCLADLSLLELSVNDTQSEPTEDAFQDAIVQGSRLPNFDDWLFVLRYLIFYFEDRTQLVWDHSAQRQLLRALLLEEPIAVEWATSEQGIRQLDSRVRNLQAALTREERELSTSVEAIEGQDAVRSELHAIERILEIDEEALEELQEELPSLEAELSRARLEFLKAEAMYESASRALERLELEVLQSSFPTASQTARYLFTRLMAEQVCLGCGTHSPRTVEALRERIESSQCVVCGSPTAPANEAPSHQALSGAKQTVARSESRYATTRSHREETEQAFNATLIRIDELQSAIAGRSATRDALVRRLPPEEAELLQQRSDLTQLRARVDVMRRDLTDKRDRFAEFISQTNFALAQYQDQVKNRFDSLAREFLLEECRLVWGTHKAQVGESGRVIDFGGFELEMSGASFDAPVRRTSPNEVSESQREFIDLAFRMALIAAAAGDHVGSLVIDAPESSLDAVFVRRAADTLAAFADPAQENRLVITSNLVEGDLIPHLSSRAGIESSEDPRIIDLFLVAEPTSATRQLAEEYASVKARVFGDSRA